MKGVPWETRQESKAGRPRKKLQSVALPLTMESNAPTPVALHEISVSSSSTQPAPPKTAETPPLQPEPLEQPDPMDTVF